MSKCDKDAVVKRDKVCRVCGTKKDLTIHHIFAKGDPRREDDQYKTLLCRACHDHINLIWVKTKIKKKKGYSGYLDDEEKGFLAGAGEIEI